MAVAVMVEGHYSVDGLKPFADGYLTSRGTFQKYFSPHELRSFVRLTLDAEPVAVAAASTLVAGPGNLDRAAATGFLAATTVRRSTARLSSTASGWPWPRGA